MKTTKTTLVTKYNETAVTVTNLAGQRQKYLYEFSMYRTYILYPVPSFRFRGQLREGYYVELEVYGLIVRKVSYEGKERVTTEDDLGPLSAQQYEVNALLQLLCRTKIPSIDLQIDREDSMPDAYIAHLVQAQTALWRRNNWASPFGKTAENLLKEKLRAEEGITPPLLSPVAEHQGRRNLKARLSRMFRNNGNGKGVDM